MNKREAAPIKLAVKKLKEELPGIIDVKFTLDVTRFAHTAEITVKFKKNISLEQSEKVRDLLHNLELPVTFAILYASNRYLPKDAQVQVSKQSDQKKAPLTVKGLYIKTKRYRDGD